MRLIDPATTCSSDQPAGVIAASGARGQWILAVPDRQLVVVSTAENANAQRAAPGPVLNNDILPAVRQ